MATTSTASSGTEDPSGEGSGIVGDEAGSRGPGPAGAGASGAASSGPQPSDAGASGAPGAPQAPAGPARPAGHDPARRAFFRAFGKQAVTAAGQVAGVADVLGFRPAAAAANLLSLGLGGAASEERRAPTPVPVGAARLAAARPAASTSASDIYRSPYRLEGDLIRILDQRHFPHRLEELTCRRGSDVTYYLRVGAARGGPIMAQLAAYAMAMSAASMAPRPLAIRRAEAERMRRGLLAARPSSRLIGWALERMAGVEAPFSGDDDGPAEAIALRAEADGIAGRMQLDQAAIARHLVAALPQPEGRPLSLLVHGAPGSLAGGLAGTAIPAIVQLAAAGRDLRVRVTESRPFLEGARLATWELRQGGIAYQVLPDAAVAWLLSREPVDAILVAAEWVAANGDTATLLGGRAIAIAAAHGGAAGSEPAKVVVSALGAVIDPGTPDGAAIPAEMRPGRELASFAPDLSADHSNALNPAVDVVPAHLIGALVTEHGAVSPVSPEAVGALALASARPGQMVADRGSAAPGADSPGPVAPEAATTTPEAPG